MARYEDSDYGLGPESGIAEDLKATIQREWNRSARNKNDGE